MEIGKGEQSPEDTFIERLGLVNAEETEHARKLATTYLETILELNTSGVKNITPDLRFTEDLSADSLEVLEFLEILQEKCNVDLPTEAFDGATTTGKAFEVFYRIARRDPGDDNLSGDREPRNPVPSAPSGSSELDLPS